MEVPAVFFITGTAGAPLAALFVWAWRRSQRPSQQRVPEAEQRAVGQIWRELGVAVAEAGRGPREPFPRPDEEDEALDRLLQAIANVRRAMAYVAPGEQDVGEIDAALEPLRTLEAAMEAGAQEDESGSDAAGPFVVGRGLFRQR